MTAFLIYNLKAGLLLAVFYGLYCLLMRTDTLFRLRRMALMLSTLLSFLLPLCTIEWHVVEILPYEENAVTADTTEMMAAAQDGSAPLLHYGILLAGSLLLAGMVVMGLRSLKDLMSLHRIIHHGCRRQEQDGSTILVSQTPTRPFSFLHYIVMSEADYGRDNKALLIHEQSHIRHHHTLDLFIQNTVLTLQWFNPVAWRLRKAVAMVHEFEADEDVLNAGVPTSDYLQLLIDKATGSTHLVFANTLSEKRMLRQRVEMLAKQRSPRWSWLKILFLLPVAAVSLGMSAHVVRDYIYTTPDQRSTSKAEKSGQKKSEAAKTSEKPAPSAEYKAAKADVSTTADEKTQGDSTTYVVDGIEVEKATIDDLQPNQIKQITIVKNPDGKTVSPGGRRTVYVDLNDTIIKQKDDDTFILFDNAQEYEEYQQERSHRDRVIAEATEEARLAAEEAKAALAESKKSLEADRKALEAERKELQKEYDETKRQAKQARAEAEKKAQRAKIAAEVAKRKAIEAHEQAIRQKKRAEAVLEYKKRQIERQLKEHRQKVKKGKGVTIAQLHFPDDFPADSIPVRLTIDSDGTIANITAFCDDSIDGGLQLLVCSKDKQGMVITYKAVRTD